MWTLVVAGVVPWTECYSLVRVVSLLAPGVGGSLRDDQYIILHMSQKLLLPPGVSTFLVFSLGWCFGYSVGERVKHVLV